MTEKKPPVPPPQVSPPLAELLTAAELEALKKDAEEAEAFARAAFGLPPHKK